MVKRYDMREFDHSIEQYEDGSLVSYDDYAALAERCERLEVALRGLHREVQALVEDETLPDEAINHPSMIAAREALRSGT